MSWTCPGCSNVNAQVDDVRKKLDFAVASNEEDSWSAEDGDDERCSLNGANVINVSIGQIVRCLLSYLLQDTGGSDQPT